MYCPKCGNNMEEGKEVCTSCGLDIATINQEEKVIVKDVAVSNVQSQAGNPIIKFVYWGLAVVVLIMFFMAASNITAGGNEIMQIQSVGGKTLEEAYYAELGMIYAGYAMISRALGIVFSSILVWLGFKS